MKKIICITFPRSGNHLLADVLKAYMGNKLKYCDHYNCCYTIPCTNKDANFYKNHDFFLSVEQDIPGFVYMVQYRNPAAAIVSYWLLSKKEGWIPGKSKKEWIAFAEDKTQFWIDFMHRWIIDNPNKPYAVNYDDLTRKPAAMITRVLELFGYTRIENSRLRGILASFRIGQKNNMKKFKYLDEAFLRKIEEKCAAEMEIMNIKPFTL